MLTALRMVNDLDAGPIYLKRSLSLEGRAAAIYERAGDLVYDIIKEIIASEPMPVTQQGKITMFSRRTPDQSILPQSGSTEALYDFIRMLDAPTYPKAFIDWGQWRLEFDHARMSSDGIEAHVAIRKASDCD
jgi:methionyl-tRNA formyltransferase